MTKMLNGFDTPVPPQVRQCIVDLIAHLVAAHSLLSRSPKSGAASDAMFDRMLDDYAASVERGRDLLKKL